MSRYRRPLWLYPLFQIPALLLSAFLVIALLFALLGVGRSPVAVAIVLDLSPSTYDGQEFNAPGTVMDREIQAVKAYLAKNTTAILSQPNQIQIFGFAGGVRPLTQSFQDNNEQILNELTQTLQPTLAEVLGGGTNLDLAIQEGTQALANVRDRCRELLLVTDGEATVNPLVIAEARTNLVKINAVVIGTEALAIRAATFATGGKYLSSDVNNLDVLFAERLFARFNSNWKWILLWLGLAWIALMWMLTMPLDRWIFQGLFKMPINFSGRLALGNALFWTAATPGILWGI
ncbi:MAG: VWA domain-containing protein, partial [Hydrococcus sp. CSU_1_8]|nr:VWA domain-containing protein [Hydrococcus sp. CSU_1_8]